MFSGAITALITPFDGDRVDENAFQTLVEWQIEEGIHGLVPCGTTGESPTLSHDEHNRVVELCVEAANGKVPVIAGAGSNSTAESIMMAQHAKVAGADAVLVVTPYYNKPSQEGIFQHIKAIHDAADIPIILYNIPGRSVIDMHDKTIVKMAGLENVVGIKDATGDLSRVLSLREKLTQDFCQLSGEDATAVAFNVGGGTGVISVSSNVAPQLVANVQTLCIEGKYEEATKLQQRLIPLHQAMFCSSSPGPVKYAASLLGKCKSGIRLPLVEPDTDAKKQIEASLKHLDLM